MVFVQYAKIMLKICELEGKTERDIEAPFDRECLRINLYYVMTKIWGKHAFSADLLQVLCYVAMYDLKTKTWGRCLH